MPNSSLHCLLQHSVEVQYISWQPDLLKAVGKVHVKIVTLPFELLLCREVFIFWERSYHEVKQPLEVVSQSK